MMKVGNHYKKQMLSGAIMSWLTCSICLTSSTVPVQAEGVVYVTADRAHEEAKLNSQQVQIITKKDIEAKQAKSVEDIIFTEAGITRTVDGMGRVGVSIRGAEPRHTLILVDGQPVMGEFAKYQGQGDELQRLGTENVERIEIIQGAASAKYGSDAIGGVINVITNKPTKQPNIRINAESIRHKGDSDFIPYSNFFMRADSGVHGKLRVNIHGSKRDITPVYATKERRDSIFKNENEDHQYLKNSLRYYGTNSNIGVAAIYDVNDRNAFSFRLDRYNEDLERYVKRSNSDLEPQVHYKRDLDRNHTNFAYEGKDEKSSWKVEANYSRTKEDDVTLTSDYGKSTYEGKNTLNYVDNVDHRQWSIHVTGDTQVNDHHLLSFGAGYTTESGEGSRLKNAPHTWVRKINPWDYDKSLSVKQGIPSSTVYRHSFIAGEGGVAKWDKEKEWYNYDGTDATRVPEFTYEDFANYLDPGAGLDPSAFQTLVYDTGYTPNNMQKRNPDALKRFEAFNKALNELPENKALLERFGPNRQGAYAEKNPRTGRAYPIINPAYLALYYYIENPEFKEVRPYFNGARFKEEYNKRINEQTVGSARLRKQHFFLQDTWQMNKNTILQPIVRLDHSDLFGSHMTFNVGVTHNVGGNSHRRLKANVGTSYTEPGMGELYYNWEMYGPNITNVIPLSGGRARLGWYWVGNPDLKPETSKNIDISFEGENKNTYFKLTGFRNNIKNYMTIANTGYLMDFHPELDASTFMGFAKFAKAPDMIYTFRNIGKARINGLELEVKQKLSDHARLKIGYTYLDAVNKSNPDMPKRLLDKPMQKLDLGLELEDKVSGWSGSIWTDYYYHMIDSNSLDGGGSYITSYIDPTNKDKSVIEYEFNNKKSGHMYKRKSYGIWNMMVQKKINKDSLLYFGINNMFNHRDDDRALQTTQYRFGMNLKFGPDKDTKVKDKSSKLISVHGGMGHTGGKATSEEKRLVKELEQTVLDKPFDTNSSKGVDLIGDVRFRGDSHLGSDRPTNRVTAYSSISDGALKNLQDKNEHGFKSRLRLGVNGRLGKNTNIKVLGSAQGSQGIDTSHTTTGSKGLKHSRIETLDVTQHASHWDFSVGRLQEALGMTGYWFNSEYDGIRTVWTGNTSQLRLGYGDFRRSTGIQDSAYTHAIYTSFKRPPTVDEFVGTTFDKEGLSEEDMKLKAGAKVEKVVENAPNTINFYQQLKALAGEYKTLSEESKELTSSIESLRSDIEDTSSWAPSEEEKVALREELKEKQSRLDIVNPALEKNIDAQYDIVGRMQDIVLKAYGKDASGITIPIKLDDVSYTATGKYIDSYYDEDEEEYIYDEHDNYKFTNKANPSGANLNNPLFKLKLDDVRVLKSDTRKEYLQQWFETNKEAIKNAYTDRAMESAKIAYGEAGTVYGVDIDEASLNKVSENLYHLNFMEQGNTGESTLKVYGSDFYPYLIAQYFNNLVKVLEGSDGNSKLPREAFLPYTGAIIPAQGIVLQRDIIPSVKRGGFVQLRHMVGRQLALSAWYMRSTGHEHHVEQYALQDKTEASAFNRLVNVIGIGAKYKMGNATLSVDYGQNRTDFGRFMNGHTGYAYDESSSTFTATGRQFGKHPHFLALRFDVGEADYHRPGSWNGFVDYKYFDHGSFFGGNGTNAVPDRYLDGIRSFTVGGGYVPKKDFLLEAFYTFDAKGIGQRDTLYGAENFKIGNYTRIQGTYKF